MKELLAPLIGGFAGTIVMTTFLFIPRWLGFGHIDVVRAVGTLITGRTEKAFRLGFIIHIFSGIFFAYIYWALLGLSHLPLNFISGAMAGLIHGIIVMLLVSIVVMEHHPIARYHDRGPMTGFAQLIAHILYGATVGLVVQSLV